jgi:hypothetical protein
VLEEPSARRVSHGHRRVTRGCPKGIFRGCDPVGVALKWLLFHLSVLVQGAFNLADMGSHELKGVAEPMPVFRVLGPAEMHQDEDESTPDGGVFLVGRDEEVGLLLRRWEQAKEGLGQVVLI